MQSDYDNCRRQSPNADFHAGPLPYSDDGAAGSVTDSARDKHSRTGECRNRDIGPKRDGHRDRHGNIHRVRGGPGFRERQSDAG